MKRDKKVRKASKTGDRIFLIAGMIFLVVFIASGAGLLHYYLDYRAQKQTYDGIAALRDGTGEANRMTETQTGSDALDGSSVLAESMAKESYERLKAVNADYIGWITVADTNIDYPVTQRDNSYYLNHDFYGEKSSHGAIFLDEGCTPDDPVILIHGHHMKDGTMFGALKNFKKQEFRENHRTLYLDWGEGDQPYRIFAAALIDLTKEDYFPYNELPAAAEDEKSYLEAFRQSAFWYDEPQQSEGETGQIVLLSTCEYGTAQQRLVIAAVSEEFE